nr:MAG: ORF1 [TTV-like mini virus]
MPWWRRNYYRRRRNFRFRRSRNPFWRKFRRRNRVRNFKYTKRKLKKLYLTQWQPPNIRKCYIKGLECLVLYNQQRMAWNSTMYENSTVPATHPGGGGFSVMQFNLQNLFTMHEQCRNWWTASNEDLPLFRYLYCELKLYQAQNVDYICKYQTAYPMLSNKLSYPSCQPSMLMMSNNKVMIPSKATMKLRKPYKKIRILPPPQFENRWYFTKDIATKPFIMLHTAACSFDNYYINPKAENNNITIYHINTTIIKNSQFNTVNHDGWSYKGQGTLGHYLYWYTGTKGPNESANFKITDLIPLSNPKDYVSGLSYSQIHNPTQITYQNYMKEWYRYYGNPFITEYTGGGPLYTSQTSPKAIQTAVTSKSFNQELTVSTVLTQATPMQLVHLQEELILQTRYNPNTDTGESVKMWLVKNTTTQEDWNPPEDKDIVLEGFPLWLNIWGYVDFQKQLKKLTNIDEGTMLAFTCKTTKPLFAHTFVPVDYKFVHEKSPYADEVLPQDKPKWFPQVQYQVETINNIASTGPGAPKLNDIKGDEIKCKYSFCVKFGGQPAKMITVNNPIEQIVYPIPRNEFQTTTLQGPTQAFESLLYTFDQRNHQLTENATQRILKDWGLTNTLSSITEPAKTVPAIQTLQALLNETQTEEEEEKTLFQQLQQHRLQQQQLRQRIFQLIQNMQKSE